MSPSTMLLIEVVCDDCSLHKKERRKDLGEEKDVQHSTRAIL